MDASVVEREERALTMEQFTARMERLEKRCQRLTIGWCGEPL